LICYDFDARSERMSRYSMPTKTAECMASGTPILVYGPAGLPIVRYGRGSGWAYVLSNPDLSAIREVILQLATDTAMRESLGRRAMALAAQNHDAANVSQAFQQLLFEVAQRDEKRHVDASGR
jgi:glycosyltransferase involved in cell wall biosynthesis